jgi:F0F1-type ATP synthase assembly protein I
VQRPQDDATKAMGQGYALLSVGITFALTVAGFVLLGVWVDRRLATTPLFIILGALVGVALGGFWMYQRVVRQPRRDESAR